MSPSTIRASCSNRAPAIQPDVIVPASRTRPGCQTITPSRSATKDRPSPASSVQRARTRQTGFAAALGGPICLTSSRTRPGAAPSAWPSQTQLPRFLLTSGDGGKRRAAAESFYSGGLAPARMPTTRRLPTGQRPFQSPPNLTVRPRWAGAAPRRPSSAPQSTRPRRPGPGRSALPATPDRVSGHRRTRASVCR